MDIITGENCRQFRLLTLYSGIGQLVHLVRGEEIGWMGGIVILACCKFHFIRVHDNLM